MTYCLIAVNHKQLLQGMFPMQITYTNSISGQQHNYDKMTATFHHAILFTIKSIFNDLKVNSDNYDKHIVPNIVIDIK